MKLYESDFKNLADHAPVLIWVSNQKWDCLYVNHRWCQFTGQTEKEASGKGWQKALTSADLKIVTSTASEALDNKVPFEVQFRLRRYDGDYRWMICNASPRYSANDEFLGYIGTCIENHNERMLREQAIDQQTKLNEFYHKTPVLLQSVNEEGVLLSVSDSWLDHFGYQREEVIGRNRTEFLTEESKVDAIQNLQDFLKDGICENLNLCYTTKDGHIRDIRLNAIAETDFKGRFIRSIGVLEDVTESRKSLRKLQQTRLAFDQSGEAIFWISLQGKIIDANQQACDSLGYTQAELLTLSVWDIDSEETRENWEKPDWINYFKSTRTFRSVHQRKNKALFPVEVNAKLIQVDNESFICSFVRDLSDTIRHNQEFAQTKRKLEEALRSGNIGLWDWDMREQRVYYSPEWKTQVGLPPDADINGYEEWENRVHPDDLAEAKQRLSDYLKGLTDEYVSVFQFRHENGTYRWIRAQGRVFFDEEDGTPERMIGVHVDVTYQKKAQIALGERTAELEAIFNASPDMFFRTNKEGVIEDYRVSSQAIFEEPEGGFDGVRIFDIIPESARKYFEQAYNNLSRTGQSQTVEYKLRVHNDEAWQQAVFVTFQEKSVAIFFRDITSQKTSELNLMKRTKELERSNADLDRFAYVASHDLKSPLRGIQHLTKWIREDSEGTLPETCNEHLDRLDEQANRMHTLLSGLLQYSRAGRVRVAVEPIDLEDLFDEIVGLVQPPEKARINLETNDIELLTGRAPLLHVLLNLIDNALKHHDRDDPQIHVSVNETSDPEYVQFEVSDDGPGVSPEHHELIFEMFQRLDPRISGTGMGLAVTRKMIETRGGKIELISKPGQGSKFYFTWPSMRDLPEDIDEDDPI